MKIVLSINKAVDKAKKRDSYHILILDESMIFIALSKGYSSIIGNLLDGVADLIGVSGGLLSWIGSLTTEVTSKTANKSIDEQQARKNQEKVDQAIQALRDKSKVKKGVVELSFDNPVHIHLRKKNFLFKNAEMEIATKGWTKTFLIDRGLVAPISDALHFCGMSEYTQVSRF